MSGILTIVLVAVGVLALVSLVIRLYNDLVRWQNRVEQAYGTIDVQLTQRWDLIPNLVATVRQYMIHERDLLETITRLRAEASSSQGPEDRLTADGELSRALGQFRMTVENYPQLQADAQFLQLQRSLNEVEEQIAAARRSYNGAVTGYNTALQTFPGSVVALVFRFRPRPMYAAEEPKRGRVEVEPLLGS